MVLVSHRHRFVFLKTSKTASTSVEMYLEPCCLPPGHAPVVERRRWTKSRHGIVGTRGLRPRHALLRRLHPWWNHMPAQEVQRRLGAQHWAEYLKIAVFRNPFDRMLSRYLWKSGAVAPETEEQLEGFLPGFRDYVLTSDPANDHDIVHIGTRYVIDHPLYFESLQPDLAALCDRLGIAWNADALPHMKKRRGDRALPLSAFYDQPTRRRVVDRSAWLFDLHGYSHDPDHVDPHPPEALQAASGRTT